MTLNIKDGLVQIDDTLEDKITNFHLNRGFSMLSAFRSECTFEQNRISSNQLANSIKSLGYYFIKVTGYYIESIGSDNQILNEAKSMQDLNTQNLSVMVESFLVPMYDIKTKKSTDFNTFKSDMIEVGRGLDQGSILIVPPSNQDNLTIANAASTFFLMKEKTLNEISVGSIKFKSAWLDEPAHTISGVRIRVERNELPPFGSHYYGNSRIYNLTTLE